MNRTVCVVGATGKQGGSVCSNLLQQGFSVRGMTRDTSSDKAKTLKGMGVEVVQASMDDVNSMVAAFKGCWGVYVVTDFYQEKVKQNPELEYIQGKNQIDACVQAGVEYVVCSVLDDVKTVSGGKLSKVFHFTNKWRVGQYLKTKNELKGIYVLPAFYMQNFSDLMPVQRDSSGAVVFSFPFPGTVRLPLININDNGVVIAAIFKNPDQYVNKEILVCGDYQSMNDYVAQFKQSTNEEAIYKEVTEEEMRGVLPKDVADEFIEMFRWFSEYGYYGARDVNAGMAECKKIAGETGRSLQTWREWLMNSGWKGPDIKLSIGQQISHVATNIANKITGKN